MSATAVRVSAPRRSAPASGAPPPPPGESFHATPARFAFLLPGYGPTRVMIDGAYSDDFHAAVSS